MSLVWNWIVKLRFWIGLILVYVILTFPVHQSAIFPGTVYPVSDLFAKENKIKTLGQWYFLTVRVLHLNVSTWIWAYTHPDDYEIIPDEWIMKPGETNEQYSQREQNVMLSTIDTAKLCASNLLERSAHVKQPFSFQLDATEVGGPSAGSAFCLAFADAMSEDDWSQGRKIAITGTVDEDGNIGEIGGLKWKIRAAIDAGIQDVYLPFGETAEAEEAIRFWKSRQIANADRIRIVPVKTTDEILQKRILKDVSLR